VRSFWDLIPVAILLTCVMGFFYSWFRLAQSYAEKSWRWRDWTSFAAMALVSVDILIRFVMPAFWGQDLGDKVRLADKWAAVSLVVCAVGLLLGLLGRPRLIAPIASACIGTALFWVLSTIP